MLCDAAAAPWRARLLRRLAGWFFIAASGFACIILLLNLLGCCIHLYTNIGSKDLILGGGIGVTHIAIAPHTDISAVLGDPMMQTLGWPPGHWHTDIAKIGPFHLFAEPPAESFQPFRFDFVHDAEYTAIEFPLLITIVVLATFGVLLLKGRRVT